MRREWILWLALIAGVVLVIYGLARMDRMPGAVLIEEPVVRGYAIQTMNAYATQTMTISTSAITISHGLWGWGSTDVTDAEKAIISAYRGSIAITWDGSTTVQATVGRPVEVSKTVEIVGTGNIANLQFIRTGDTNAIVSITLEK